MLLSSFLSFSLLNIDWFLGFMWLDGQNIFGRRVRLVGQATKSETDHAGWVPWRLSTFTPYISFLFKSKISPGVFTSDSIVKDCKDWIQACFLVLTLHAKPFQPKCFRNWLLQLRKTVSRLTLGSVWPIFPCAAILWLRFPITSLKTNKENKILDYLAAQYCKPQEMCISWKPTNNTFITEYCSCAQYRHIIHFLPLIV